MKKIKDFNDYLFDILLENKVNKNMPFRLSKRLYELLRDIEHPISTKLIFTDSHDENKPITLVDYDPTELNKFVVSQSNKVYDYIKKEKEPNEDYIKRYFRNYYDINNEFKTKNRSSTKIGKIINKLFPDEFLANGKLGEDIESFVDAIRIERTKNLADFKLVKGDNIIKYYNKKIHQSDAKGSTLENSCMAYEKCADYIKFYAENPVKLLILMSNNKDEEDKIKGRALVWEIGEMDGKEVDRIFMDRIYTIHSYDESKFKEYAESNGGISK